MSKLMQSTDARAAAVSGSSRRARASHKRHILTSVSALSLALSFGNAGFAQTAKNEAQIDEVIVTGSHIVRDGYEAPSPLTVISIDQIEAGAREDLASYIALMPATVANYTPQSNSMTTNTGQSGVSSVNLRSLGTVRTLVLLDGRRSVPTAPDGTIDISEFPQELVSRVDVVTGGGSAAYGSDAIAGVLNFIIDKTYTGVKGSLEGGVTTYGDDRNWKATLTAGTSFANDRGHFLISGSVAVRDGILHQADAREWARQGLTLFQNPAYAVGNGQPQYLLQQQTGAWAASFGGVITSNNALKGTEFGPGGVPFMYDFGTATSGTISIGGGWKSRIGLHVGTLDPSSKRQSLYTRFSYDVTDNFNVFAEVSWANSFAHLQNAAANVANIAIKADNAFIPAAVRTRMTALGITSFVVGRYHSDLNVSPDGSIYGQDDNIRRLNRYTIGASGNVDAFNTNWSWDVYAHTGQTRVSQTYYNAVHTQNHLRAVDAVVSPTTGAIVCRSTLTNPTNGCVPYNVMGLGVNSQAAINYVAGTTHLNQKITQDNLAASFSGEPFSLWAGPVSFAAGFEWRKEQISGVANALSAAFGANTANYQPTIGKQTVSEGFLETVIPLAKDQTWAQSLDLNAAVRFTEYSLSGFGTSYKIGATYQPITDLRFRATRSHDFRAPNLGELFSGGSTTNSFINDPFNNNLPTNGSSRLSGNPNLVPEKSDSTQVGVVFQPTFLPGFSASMDYWHIKVNNVIGAVTNVQILNNCFNGLQSFCNAITRTPGNIVILIQPFNLGAQRRNGLDLEAGYKFRMSDIVDSWGGDLELRALATRHFKAIVDGIPGTGNPPTDYAGSFVGLTTPGANTGVPTWVYTTTLTYSYDPIRVTLTGRGFSGGTMDNNYVGCTSGCPASTLLNPTISSNTQPGIFYVDASINYKVNDVANLFFAVNNIANLDPPPYLNLSFANSPTFIPANYFFYDTIGRTFRAGIRFKM
jgi:iron complex outermembrane receptor protein